MATGVIERPAEFRAIREFLHSADRQPAGLVIQGEAGIGKTTLWLAGLAEARERGFRIFTARAAEAETLLPYAAVADLLGGVEPAALAELPEVQRLAVDRVLLRATGDGPPTDEGVVAAALATIIERLSADAPAVVAIDDAQWLDPSSQAVLALAARRLTGRVGLLITERTEHEGASAANWIQLSTPDDIGRLRIGPLSLGALHALIFTRLGKSFPRPTMARIDEISGGNPFYALELARAIDAGASQSVLPATLAELMRRRIGRLDRETQDLLLAAACAASPTVGLLAEVTHATVDRAVELLGEAKAKGIVGFNGGAVQFAHPLLARSVYTDATPGRRRAMHRSLAEAVTLPESRARHMALAASSADPTTLNALDAAAGAAHARGAPAAAAELIDLAIGLGGDEPARRIRAAEYHFKAGDAERARATLEDALDTLPSGPLKATALNLMAGIHLYDDKWADAVNCLERALIDAVDSMALLVQTLTVLAFAHRMVAKYDESLDDARRAVAYAEELGDPALISRALAMSVQLNLMYGNGVDEQSLRRAIDLEGSDSSGLSPFRARMIEALVLAWTGRLDDARAAMALLRQEYTERGAENDLMAIVTCSSFIEIWQANFAEAARLAQDSMERAELSGGSLAIALSMRAMAAAYVGREQDARADARAALDIADRTASPRLAEWPTMTLGFLEVSLGNYADAIKTLEPMRRTFDEIPGTEILTASFIPDAVEALIALGRHTEAEPMITRLESNGRRLDRPWMLAIGARCRAMAHAARGDVDAAVRMTHEAMAHHDRLPMPFERARTLLLLGQLQPRQRKKEPARATLMEAAGVFRALGTPLWAERAEAALARISVTTDRAALGLTPSEQRVAELAASGMTTREVAATLFISPKTVETNLAHIYRKLGIKSRAELGRLIGDRS